MGSSPTTGTKPNWNTLSMLCMLTLPSSFFIIIDVDKNHYGHVYEIINLINDKTCVGQHKYQLPEMRNGGHTWIQAQVKERHNEIWCR